MDLKVNDRVELKKTHPCGSKEWLVGDHTGGHGYQTEVSGLRP